MPWKNGGGTTTELWRSPATDPFDVRVSVAEVEQSGPFSTFPECDRAIVMIAGEGMVLEHEQRHRVALQLDVPHLFSGDVATSCLLTAGATRDFNVITRRGRAAAAVAVTRLAPGATLHVVGSLAYLIEGECSATGEGARARLSANETILVDPGEVLIENVLDRAARIITVAIRR